MKRILGIAALLVATSVSAMAIELPPEIAKRGSIKVALVPNYPPMEFRDPATSTLTGFDIDLGEAIGRKLGLKIEWQETSFDQFMPSISTGRVDAILSGFTDYASRHETATFIDYLRTGPHFFVQQSRAAEFKDMAALCGKKVGASRRTMFPAMIASWSEKNCGSNPVVFVGTDGSADARTQLKQGRIDAAVQGSETLPYAQTQEPGKYRVVGEPFAKGYQGIMFRKDDTALREVVTERLAAMIADGAYKAILEKWGLGANAVAQPMLNAAPQ